MKPLISVFMPTYNQEHFISEAIDSVLIQEYDNLEIVIVDDASTDKTPKIIKEYDRKYPGLFKIKINKKNLGITSNCNVTLAMCTGKYIAFTAGDDIWLPGKLKKQVDMMENTKQCVLCYHDIEVFDSKDNSIIRYWNSGIDGQKPYEGSTKDVVKQLVKKGTVFMAALSVMVRRSTVPQWGFDERVPVASDWLMWIEVLANSDGNVRYIHEALAKYRRHENNVTLHRHDEDTAVILAIVEARYPWFSKYVRHYRGRMYYSKGVSEIRNGNTQTGRLLLKEGVLYYSWYSWKWLGWWVYSWLQNVN